MFFGGFLAGPGGPNEDAAAWLVEDVMPLLWDSACRGSSSRSSAPTRRRACASCRGRTSRSSGSCPIRSSGSHVRACMSIRSAIGAGIKLKLIDTMAAGLPFVTTPTGAEGLGLGDLEEVLVADDAGRARATRARALPRPRAVERVQSEATRARRGRFGRETFRRTLTERSRRGVAPPGGPS